jgi:hypothetical protein
VAQLARSGQLTLSEDELSAIYPYSIAGLRQAFWRPLSELLPVSRAVA